MKSNYMKQNFKYEMYFWYEKIFYDKILALSEINKNK